MAFKGITAWILNKSSGGGGTVEKDYNKLDNKPTINGHTIVGNQTSESLGIPTDIVGTYSNENLSISIN